VALPVAGASARRSVLEMKLRISVNPMLCGPVSVGTVDLIKVIREHCNFGLGQAKEYIDEAVFGGAIVDIPLPDETDGQALVDEIRGLETRAEISVQLID